MPFVASGSYGCVFKPHLKCENKTKYDNSIGKVFGRYDEYASELNIMNIVYKLDPQGSFTLPVVGTCTTSSKTRKSDKVDRCNHMDMSVQDQYNQMILKYGGKSIDNFIFTSKLTFPRFIRILQSLQPILNGLEIINNKRYVHQDIKPENIMYLKKKLYLIDFGLFQKQKDVYTTQNEILHADYIYFPPEYKLYNTSYSSRDQFITSCFDSFIQCPPIGDAYIDFQVEVKRVLNIDIASQLQELYDTFQSRKDSHDRDFSTFARKIDVYQIGIVLFFALLSTGLCDRQQTKRVNKTTSLIEALKKYISELLCFNVYKRCTIKDALREYKTNLASHFIL